jgi:hypothetical protein
MENNNSKAGFQIMQKWYKKKSGIKLPMSHHHLATVSTEYTALYAAQPPSQTNVLTGDSHRVEF